MIATATITQGKTKIVFTLTSSLLTLYISAGCFFLLFHSFNRSLLFADLVRTASLVINPHSTKQVVNVGNYEGGKKPGTLEVVVF